ncbi:MAG: hypothetical protein LAP86_14975 [Acidobacteriia bacterium]|nr:hypothetical protein [Terriglobia bacterium]
MGSIANGHILSHRKREGEKLLSFDFTGWEVVHHDASIGKRLIGKSKTAPAAIKSADAQS